MTWHLIQVNQESVVIKMLKKSERQWPVPWQLTIAKQQKK